jgi:hypothetical protein
MRKKLTQKVKEAVHKFSFFGKVEEIADKRRHAFNRRFDHAQVNTKKRQEELEAVKGHGTTPEFEDAEQLLWIAQTHERKMLRKREFWRDRYTWAHARHSHWGSVVKHRRDRLRRWVRQHQGFQPYMANGHPHEKLTPEARHGIYLAFRDGNFVTSTYEGFPGDGVHATSSYHYLQNQPDGKARCWDAGAGTRAPMVKTQIRQAREFGPFLTEQFGPENTFAYKNGIQFTLAEGTELEEMHDNHVHTDIRDGAPTK